MASQDLAARLKGIMVPIMTPFGWDYELNTAGIAPTVDYLLENGVDVIIPLGSNGEFASMTVEERKRVAEATLEAVNGRAPVIVGTSHSCLKDALELTHHAQEIGADGVMMVPPYYYRPTDDEVFEFFRIMDSEVDIPILLYNNPATTKVNLSLDMFERLGTLPHLVGIKESNSQPVRYFEELMRFGDSLTIIPAGEPPMIFNVLSGAPGFITVSATFCPQLIREMFDAAQAKDLQRAFDLYRKLIRYRQLFQARVDQGYAAYIPHAKAALNLLGFPAGPTRPPLAYPSPKEIGRLRRVLEEDFGFECVD